MNDSSRDRRAVTRTFNLADRVRILNRLPRGAISRSERIALFAALQWADADGVLFPSMLSWAAAADMSVSTLADAIRKLIERGYLVTRSQNRGRSDGGKYPSAVRWIDFERLESDGKMSESRASKTSESRRSKTSGIQCLDLRDSESRPPGFGDKQSMEHSREQSNSAFACANACATPSEHSCGGAFAVDQEPPNRSEPDDEDDRLAQIAREIIGPAVGLGMNNIPAVRIGEIVRASGGYAVNGRDRAEWGGDEPLDRARMLRAGLDVGLARMNGCRGMQALHTVRRVAIAAMHDAIPAGEYPAVFAENHKGPKFEKIEGW